MSKTVIVGITGQTGAGKSTLAKILSKSDIPIIDADIEAKEVLKKDKSLIPLLKQEFGSDITNSNGILDRKLLASRAFASDENTKKLNNIMLPSIISDIKNKIELFRKSKENIIAIDAPLLFESGLDEVCNIIISVTAGCATRLDRIIKRDNITIDLAKKRISAQKSEKYYKDKSDIILNGGLSLDRFEHEAEKIIYQIRKKAYSE